MIVRCHSSNPGRRSTYRCGKSVQTTGPTSPHHRARKATWRWWSYNGGYGRAIKLSDLNINVEVGDHAWCCPGLTGPPPWPRLSIDHRGTHNSLRDEAA